MAWHRILECPRGRSYPHNGGGKIKRHSIFAVLLLLGVAVLPAGYVSAADSNVTSNATANSTAASTSAYTKVSPSTTVSYTYHEYVPYTVRVKVSYMKPYTVKVKTPVKRYYYRKGKYRVRYVYSYTYVTKYRKTYRWVTETRYRKVTRIGYAEMGDYLRETENCQVSDPEISSLSSNLTAGCNSTYEKAVRIFNWVRDNIDYSFYYNTRNGAVETLHKRSANCCDHTHLLVALARSANIPARYMHGKCVFRSGNTYGHVWGQLYINGKWYDADATSFSNTLGTIKNWDTSSAFIKGVYAELPF